MGQFHYLLILFLIHNISVVGVITLTLYMKELRVREVKSCVPELSEDFICRLEARNLAIC